jgi:DNA-binding FadR family transcriptional regulator
MERVVEGIGEHDADAAENAMQDLTEFVRSDVDRFFQRPDSKTNQQSVGQNKLRLIE